MISRRHFLRVASGTAAVLAPVILRAAESSTPSPGAEATGVHPPKIGLSSRVRPLEELQPAQVITQSAAVCRILQFSDLHFFRVAASEDDHTLADCQKQVEREKPDLVVVNGDLWHDNPDGKGQEHCEFAVRAFSRWGVPWTTNWGNHDLLGDPQKGHDALAAGEHSCYRGAESHGDYRLEVIAAGAGSGAAPALDLLFLNSNDEGLGAWQLQSLARMQATLKRLRSNPTPAILFFHVPLADHETRLRPDNFTGVKLEGVSHYKENGAAFPVIQSAKNIRACFCGHNHVNDYVVKADGLGLHFGRATGYAGYGGERVRKGAKVIEVDLKTAEYKQHTVFADGTSQTA